MKESTASDEVNLSQYFNGEKLYGDDFTISQIEAWYNDELEGYANVLKEQIAPGEDHNKLAEKYVYMYHALNKVHGYRYLNGASLSNVLGLGSAFGHEFVPLLDRIRNLTILEPSQIFSKTGKVFGRDCTYVRPVASGHMPFSEESFDLITSFGVLHHIANVSHVVSECFRCLKPGAYFLLREPIVSMGDWRQPRPRLSKRERGIPLNVFRQIIPKSGFEIVREQLFDFQPVIRTSLAMGVAPYNNSFITRVDGFLARCFAWNLRYHARNIYEKFRPCSVYYVLRKPA